MTEINVHQSKKNGEKAYRKAKFVAPLFAVAAAAIPFAGLTATAPAANAATSTNCPSGYVCLYNGTTQASGVEAKWVNYGAHNLSNVLGQHLVVNNQTGGATYEQCRNYDGVVCGDVRKAGSYVDNLTPINSLRLLPPAGSKPKAITKAGILKRLNTWKSDNFSYQNAPETRNGLRTGKYNADCSGLVSDALQLSTDEDTWTLQLDTSNLTKRLTLANPAERAKLSPSTVQTGDVFVDDDGYWNQNGGWVGEDHAWIFGQWISPTKFTYYSFGGGTSSQMEMTGSFSQANLGQEALTHYDVYRYRNITS